GDRTCPKAGLSPALEANRPPLPGRAFRTGRGRTMRRAAPGARNRQKGMKTMTKAVSEATFGQEVLSASEPVLVDFWAEWCGPCRAIAPVLDELSSELEGRVKIVKLNVDENPGIAAQYGVRSIPTMILFKGGEAADMKIGAGTPKAGLSKWLEGHAA